MYLFKYCVVAICLTILHFKISLMLGFEIFLTETLVLLLTGLHKLCHPTILDGSTWSKFGARGEHGDVFLFSNFNRCALILRELNQIFIAYYIC